MLEIAPISEKPWIPEMRGKMITERTQLLRTESFLASQLQSVRARINQLNGSIAESYGDAKQVVNRGVDRALEGARQQGLASDGEPRR